MDRQRLLHLALGAAVAIAIIVPLGAFAFVKSGIFDVAAFRPHTKFTEWLTHDTMIHSVKRHATSIAPPETFAADQVLAGFCQYDAHCVACHGAAGVARQPWANGLEPGPPYLLDVHQRFTRRQLFWIVQNGIKMTGMPSWRESMSDRQISDVVAWLEASPHLPPQTYVNLRRQRVCPQSNPLPVGERAG